MLPSRRIHLLRAAVVLALDLTQCAVAADDAADHDPLEGLLAQHAQPRELQADIQISVTVNVPHGHLQPPPPLHSHTSSCENLDSGDASLNSDAFDEFDAAMLCLEAHPGLYNITTLGSLNIFAQEGKQMYKAPAEMKQCPKPFQMSVRPLEAAKESMDLIPFSSSLVAR